MINRMEDERGAHTLKMSRRQKNKAARDAANDFASELLNVIATGPLLGGFHERGEVL